MNETDLSNKNVAVAIFSCGHSYHGFQPTAITASINLRATGTCLDKYTVCPMCCNDRSLGKGAQQALVQENRRPAPPQATSEEVRKHMLSMAAFDTHQSPSSV